MPRAQMRNQTTIYQATTQENGVVNLTTKNGIVKHASAEKIIGWDIDKLITYCSIKGYSLEKLMNIVCLDGHENDEHVMTKSETKAKQTGEEWLKEPPGITMLKEERKKKEAKSKVKKRKA